MADIPNYKLIINSYSTKYDEIWLLLFKTKLSQNRGVEKEEKELSEICDSESKAFILDFYLTTITAILDISVIGQHFSQSEYNWERLYFLRTTYLSIHAFGSRFHNQSINFFKICKEILPQKLSEIELLQNDIHIFYQKYGDTIKRIRDTSIGHYDSNILKFHSTIQILGQTNLNVISEYLKILIQLIQIAELLKKQEENDSIDKIQNLFLKYGLIIPPTPLE